MSLDRFARRITLFCCAAVLAFGASAPAAAQEIKVTRQYGLPYLPLMVMEHE